MSTTDTLTSSTLGMLRAGYETGPVTIELMLGNAAIRTDEGGAAVLLAGLGGAYAISDQLTLRSMVSHMGSSSGDESGDVLRNANVLSLGAVYGLNDRMTVWGDLSYADGIMDQDADMGLVREISLGVDYAFGVPGLKGYGALTYADIYQGDEQDSTYDTQVSLGITYSFGNGGSRDVRTRNPIPNYENWMAITCCVLE